jgi:hypothetical protein
MRSEDTPQMPRLEPRWPVVLQVVFLFCVLAMPTRIRLLPIWFGYSLGIGLILPMIVVWLSGAHPLWLRIERVTTLVCSICAELTTLLTLGYLISEMLVRPTGLSGRQLLSSSIGAWTANVIAFSIIYWNIDRGGPQARTERLGKKAEWLFPQESASEKAPSQWLPTAVDYLYLSFCTATAFSPTDVLPITGRAKMLMMLESSVSLATLVVVASRAINILGS